MDKLIEVLVNAGFKIKRLHNTADGQVIDYSKDGKQYRIFVAPLRQSKQIQQTA